MTALAAVVDRGGGCDPDAGRTLAHVVRWLTSSADGCDERDGVAMRGAVGTAAAKVLVTGAALVGLMAACGTGASSSPATVISPAADPSGATTSVCNQIRADLASRMDSLGGAIGDYLGYRSAAAADAVEDAGETVTGQVKALAADISRVGEAATDANVRAAASKAAAAVNGIAANHDFLSDIDSLSDVPAAIAKISDAAQPVADACQ
jgi:hypothetical protein